MNINRAKQTYTFISPVYLHSSYIIMSAFHDNRMHTELNKIILFSDIAIILIFIIYPCHLLIKKEIIKSIIFIAIQVIVFFLFKSILNNYEIDSEKINFIINKSYYNSLIKNATPFKPDKKTFLIKIEPRYMNCERYLIYDKSNEFTNPENEFFGIGYTYATRANGEKFHSGNLDVRVRKYGEYLYIADACYDMQ